MFDRKKPCKTCPFRIDANGLRHLGEERAVGIVETLEGDANFTCHDDLDQPEDKRNHCVGAMLILEKMNRPNQMMRIGERVGFYDRTALTGADEVFDDFNEWIESQSDEV